MKIQKYKKKKKTKYHIMTQEISTTGLKNLSQNQILIPNKFLNYNAKI